MEVPGKTKKTNIIITNDNDDQRRFFEKCEQRTKSVCNPIIEWKNSDIWDYIYSEKIETNPLYKCGFKRVGCIGCPIAGKNRYFEFAKFPKYQIMYTHAFDRMLLVRKSKELTDVWKTGEEVFSWWMNEDINQMELSDYLTQ